MREAGRDRPRLQRGGCIDSNTAGSQGLPGDFLAWRCKSRVGAPLRLSRFFVVDDIAVDQRGDVIVVLFLFFEESVPDRLVVLDFDILVDHRRRLLVDDIGLYQRDQFDSGGRGGLHLLDLFLWRRALGARRRPLEDCSALGADDRIFVQIEEFSAAVLALALGSELDFRHFSGSLLLGLTAFGRSG